MPFVRNQVRLWYEAEKNEPASSLTLQERKANEKFIENIFTMIKEQGSWTWVDEREIYIKYGNKIVCNKKAYNKLALIVNNKWLCKKVRVKK